MSPGRSNKDLEQQRYIWWAWQVKWTKRSRSVKANCSQSVEEASSAPWTAVGIFMSLVYGGVASVSIMITERDTKKCTWCICIFTFFDCEMIMRKRTCSKNYSKRQPKCPFLVLSRKSRILSAAHTCTWISSRPTAAASWPELKTSHQRTAEDGFVLRLM